MKIILTIFILILNIRGFSFAYRDSLRISNNEITLSIENDIFFFTDRYYTAGQEIYYRRILNQEKQLVRWFNRNQVPSKVIFTSRLGCKIFTPKKTQFVNTINMDRPYVGYDYVGISFSRLKRKKTVSGLEFELGLVGKSSGLGNIQQWWHRQVGYSEPRGWESQIANELVFNLNYQFQQEIKIFEDVDLVSSTSLYVGTGSNKVSQDLTLRLIDFSPLTESIFSNCLLGNEDRNKKEVFLFFGVGVDYIVSNIFLEGSLFSGNPSPFVVEANPWLLRKNFGIMYAKNRGSFSLTFINLGEEMDHGLRHNYGRLTFSHRF